MTSTKFKSGEMFSEIFNKTVEIMSDLTTATAAASMNASFTSARRLVKFQKGATKAGLHVVAKVQDYTEKTLRDAVKDGEWPPEEGKEVVEEWASMMRSGIKEFSRVVDNSFALLLKYLDGVENQTRKKTITPAQNNSSTKTSTKKTPAARKTAAKKTPAKKASTPKAPAKKNTTKKSASRKAATAKPATKKGTGKKATAKRKPAPKKRTKSDTA